MNKILSGVMAVGAVALLAGAARAAVTLSEDAQAYTLDNGIVTVQVDKGSGDLVSLKYKNMEMLATILDKDGKPDMMADPAGANGRGFGPFTDHQYGFWSHDAMGPRDSEPKAIAKISIDPKTNGGKRAEVAIRGNANGRKMGTGPGSNAQGNFISDIEIRWALGDGESGVYTYCMFEHQAAYAASTITEARFCVKLNDFFDWMSIAPDEHHNKHYPKELREGDKYVYTTNQYNNPAFGWSSTTKNVGLFTINPSVEYMSGGPTKVEFLGHRDTNAVAAPCVLNYWRSSHYGGAEVAVAEGEHWAKVIGPFMLYVNSGADSQAMYADARAQAAKEAKKWPFDWVQGVDYPTSSQRATVKGQLALTDPLMPNTKMTDVMVGLTAPAYTSSAPAFGGGAGGRAVDWQQDAKHYEFWVHGSDDGTFEIPNVRPGQYTLHAFATGVLGEFAKTDITVESGKPLDLGKLTWTPVRKGRQIWEIGIPNRNGSEFFKGDVFYTPNIYRTYADLFQDDVVYTIGKSDYTKDWFFQHVPHYNKEASDAAAAAATAAAAARANAAATQPGAVATTGPGARGARGGARAGGGAAAFGFGGPPQMGRDTPYTIVFDLPSAPKGKATLRIALCGASTRAISVGVNQKPAGQFDRLINDGVISNHGSHGIWNEKELAFDASLLKQGENRLSLTVPAGSLTSGVIYDYLRLELDENAQ